MQFKGYNSCYSIQNREFLPHWNGHLCSHRFIMSRWLCCTRQTTSLRWNWGIFAQTWSTCLEGPYRKDSSGAHPCRAIDRAWEPRIPSPCSLKAITHALGSKIGSSRSRWNRGTEYYPVGMKTRIEYLDIFFKKYNSPYNIEMGTYVLIDLLWEGGSVAPAQPTSLRWN